VLYRGSEEVVETREKRGKKDELGIGGKEGIAHDPRVNRNKDLTLGQFLKFGEGGRVS